MTDDERFFLIADIGVGGFIFVISIGLLFEISYEILCMPYILVMIVLGLWYIYKDMTTN